MSDGVRVIAVAEGLDTSLPPTLLYDALVTRRDIEMERVRRDAFTDYTMAAFARGAQIEYWDAVEHLYPKAVMDERRRKREIEEETRRQIAMRDAILSRRRHSDG